MQNESSASTQHHALINSKSTSYRIMKSILVLITTVALASVSANAFAVSSPANAGCARQHATSLSASSLNESVGKTFAASSIVAAYLLANVLSADVALAAAPSVESSIGSSFAGDSSSFVMAARSGGRAGGRSMPRSMPRSSMGGGGGGGGRTVINRSSTTIVAPPIVMGGGGFGYGGGYGYGYDPTPGLIFHGINAIGNGIRESRQNEMIYEERSELAAAREREAEMASRIRQLEMMQMQQTGGGAAVQPQITIVQPQAVPAQ